MSTPQVTRPAAGAALAPLTCAIGLGLVMLDNNAQAVSLPTIARDIGANEMAARWLFVTFMLANLTVLPSVGTLAAIVGRRRTYQIGLALFAVGSVLALSAHSFWPLLLSRISQGIGGAMMVPNAAALLDANVPADRRTRAIATWVTVSSIGIFVGPVFGGFLTNAVSWRLIFLVELVTCVAGIALASRLADLAPERRRIDVLGMVTGGGAVCLAALGILEAGRATPNWALVGGTLALAIPTFVLFLAIQRRVPHPALDLRVFAQPRFGALIAACTAYNATVAGGQYVLSLSLQTEHGLSASAAGWVAFAAMALLPLGSQLLSLVTRRRTPQLVMYGAALGLTAAYVLAGIIGADVLWQVVPPLLAVGLAVGVLFAGDTAVVMNMVEPHMLASALSTLSLTRQLGSILGIALLGSLYQQFLAFGGWSSVDPLQGTFFGCAVVLLPAIWLLYGNVVVARRSTQPTSAAPAGRGVELDHERGGNERQIGH
ncbi:MAG TPA: MFS transporter [Micromonospora sp.]